MDRDGGDGSTAGVEFADDTVLLATHTGTHVDSLAHLWYDQKLYNGFSKESVRSSGARHCGIDKLGPIVGRGVLLDLAGVAGISALDDGFEVTAEHFERCLAEHKLELRDGDVVVLRTGWWSARAAAPGQQFASEPGPGVEAACWLAERQVAAVGADNFAFEVMPSGAERLFPVHELLLRDCGVPIIEGLALDELAAAGVFEFLFVACPLPIVGGTASPLNPIAIA
jgi:kynurenine formamidase